MIADYEPPFVFDRDGRRYCLRDDGMYAVYNIALAVFIGVARPKDVRL